MKTGDVGPGFRKRLKQQLPLLQAEGLITAEQARCISDRYRLDALASESTRTLVMVIYTVGAFLIGVGAVSFVAAHWTAIPRAMKVCLLFAAMLGAHGLGFWLWKVSRKSAALGHALIILGTLIFGASIGLIAQIFHIEGRWNGMFLPWAIGAIVMAYAVGSVPNALIAIVTSFVWFLGGVDRQQGVTWFYPFAAAAAFLPFCYWRRSAFVFAVALLATGASVVFCAGDMARGGSFIGLSLLAIGLLYACWGAMHLERFAVFGPPILSFGYAGATAGVYFASFEEIARDWLYNAEALSRVAFPVGAVLPAVLAAGIVLVTPAVLRSRNRPAFVKMLRAVLAAFGLFVIGSLTGSEWVLAGLANVALFVLAAALIWAARDLEDRRLFWSGVALVGLLVVSRTLEYETGLLIKAAVFTAGGVGVIVAGIVFERFLRVRRAVHA